MSDCPSRTLTDLLATYIAPQRNICKRKCTGKHDARARAAKPWRNVQRPCALKPGAAVDWKGQAEMPSTHVPTGVTHRRGLSPQACSSAVLVGRHARRPAATDASADVPRQKHGNAEGGIIGGAAREQCPSHYPLPLVVP